MLWEVFTHVCLPIFVVIGVGWLLDRRFGLDLNTVVKLNIALFVPAFIFVQVVQSHVEGSLALRIVAFTAAVVVALFVVSAVLAWLAGYSDSEKRALQLSAMFYNSGNYGVPLMVLAYPVTGPLLQVFVLLVQNIGTFTVGLWLVSAGGANRGRGALLILRQSSIWAIALAFLVRHFDFRITEVAWLWVPLEYLARALVPFALVTLGIQLSKTDHRQPWSRLSWALGLRLVGGPLIAWALATLAGFTGETRAILILSSSFPTAVNTALIAHEFKADSQFAAAAVFYSTILSMFTVTVLVAALRAGF